MGKILQAPGRGAHAIRFRAYSQYTIKRLFGLLKYHAMDYHDERCTRSDANVPGGPVRRFKNTWVNMKTGRITG